jgi:hypothetical protein
MAKDIIVPLEKFVLLKEDKLPELRAKVKNEMTQLPRHVHGIHLPVTMVQEIANQTAGKTGEEHSTWVNRFPGQDKYKLKVDWALKREEAYAVRKKFAEFLEEVPEE